MFYRDVQYNCDRFALEILRVFARFALVISRVFARFTAPLCLSNIL